MASVAVTLGDGGASVGRVFIRAFAAIRHNPLTTIILALLFGGAPAAAVHYLTLQVPAEYMVMTFGSLVLPGAFAVYLVQLFFAQMVGVLAQGAMTTPVLAEASGRRASLGESIWATLTALPSLIGLGVLVGTGIVIGLTLLVIPAFVLYLLWAVAAPALIAEREGMFLSITRSQELSEGARWKTLGVLIVPFAVSLVLGIVLGIGSRLLGANAFEQATIGSVTYWVILGACTNLLWSSIQASLYVELRDWKDGPATDHLQQVFA